MLELESIGTIHYRVSDMEACLFFAPDPNHSLNYSGKSYAVFVSLPPPVGKDFVREAFAVPLRNNEDSGIFIENSVPIKIRKPDYMRDVLLRAAEKQASITVRVKSKLGSSVVELVGITFPAR